MPAGLRRASALVAIFALVIGGAKIVDVYTLPGSGFSTVATVAAEPTGPPAPTGGMTDGGGSQFQPPQMPSSMPDYQGGNNQPPLDQNSGISIYNTGSPGAQQVPGQQAGQQPQQAQQPAHGTQIPDYQTATQYTQGPGKPNPDYQAPQQNAPQQPQQGQQPQQQPNQQQQPQNKQDDTTQQLDQKKQQCQAAAVKLATDAGSVAPAIVGGGGRSPIWWFEPGLDPIPTPTPPCPQGCPEGSQKPSPSDTPQKDLPPELKKYIDDQINKKVSEQVPQKVQEELQKEKEKFPIQDALSGALIGCAVTGAGAAAVAAIPTLGIASGPAAIGGCLTGLFGGFFTPIVKWAFDSTAPIPGREYGK
ncbi:hypothetical protein E3G69_000750 [Mycobacteroides abscessus]|nr:hypothetical protein [Mycobacteroides abscessus]QOF41732.1 hypothetical protein E3G69_000750 [Mycobacteroides abscessus]QOF46428.1 hypothetical protein E3G70_000746 [Mycobacteroides abscessus]